MVRILDQIYEILTNINLILSICLETYIVMWTCGAGLVSVNFN